MRLKHFVSVFLALLFLGVGQVWGTSPATLSFTSACGGSGTDSDGNSWTVSSDAAESTYDANKGVHYGTGKAAVSSLSLSTSGISGTITQIKVNASGASSTTAKLNVTVGGNAFGSEQSLTSTATTYTLTGSASGEIVISITQSSAKKALYCKSVEVTYTTGGGQQTPVLEGLTISEAPTNTTYEAGNAFDPTGLVVTGTYSQGDPQIISSGITWTACKTQNGTYVALDNEDVALAANETGIYVRATVGEVTSTEFYVTDLNVTPAKPKSTLIFTAKCNGSGTADDGVTWTVISDASAESTFDDARGIHYGTNSDAVTYIQLESAAFTDKITKIEVEASGNNNPTLAVAVGETPFGSVVTNLTTTNTKYTFEPTQAQSTTNFTGSVLVLLIKDNKAQKALYIKSIVITYEETPKHELTFGVKEGDGSKGSVTASVGGSTISTGADVTEGATVTLSPSANQYYQVKSVEVLDGNADEVTVTANAGVYTFAMPTSDAEAEVSFEYIPVTSVSVGATLELVEGETHTLSATVLPATALGTVTWASDNENVATVVETTGEVTAVAEGTANITATSTITGSKYGTCAVTVSAPAGHAITITQNTGGTVSANVSISDVAEGTAVVLTATPDAGYSVNEWTVTGVTPTIDGATCSFSMPAADVTAQATFTHETATLVLSENGSEHTYDAGNTHYWKEQITLPDPNNNSACAGKVFVGWDANSECTSAPTYAVGDPYIVPNKGENKLYAVYATPGDAPVTWEEITSVPNAGDYAICASTYAMKASIDGGRFENETIEIDEDHLTSSPSSAAIWTISINAEGKFLLKNGNNYAAGTGVKNKGQLITEATDTKAQWTITYDNGFVVTNVGNTAAAVNAILRQNGTYGWACYSADQGGAAGAPRFFKKVEGEPSYSDYVTTCLSQVALPEFFGAENNQTYTEAKTIAITAEEDATIRYTINGEEDPTESDDAFDSENPISLSSNGTYVIKAKAFKEGKSPSDVATLTVTIDLPFTTIASFIAADPSTAKKLVVTDAVVLGKTDNIIYIQDATAGIQLFASSHGKTWASGKKLSGTITCTYQNNSSSAYMPRLNVTDFGTTDVTSADPALPTPVDITAGSEANICKLVRLQNVKFKSTTLSSNSVYVEKSDQDIDTVYNTFGVLNQTLPNPVTLCDVTGVLIKYSQKYEIAPVSVDGITTNGAAAILPTLSTAGSTDSENPTAVAEGKVITVTPAAGMTTTLKDGDADATTITEATNVTISEDKAIKVTASAYYYVDAEATYYYHADPSLTERTISKASMSNGSVTVKNGDDEVSSAGQGATITLIPVPTFTTTQHYHLTDINVVDAEEEPVSLTTVVENEEYTFTMPAKAVTVSATFAEDLKYTIAFDGNGATSGEALTVEAKYANTSFEVPGKGTLKYSGKRFTGWKVNETPYAEGANFTTPVTVPTVATTITFVAQWEDLPVWATTYTSNLTLTGGGTSKEVATVKEYGDAYENEYQAIKAGSGNNYGTVSVTLPIGTTELHFHSATWNGSGTCTIQIEDLLTTNPTFVLTNDAGMKNSGTYTLEGDMSGDQYYSVTFDALEEEKTITFSHKSGTDKRFIIYGLNAIYPEITLSPASYNFENVRADQTKQKVFTITANENVTGTLTASITGTDEGKFNVSAIEDGKVTVTFNPNGVVGENFSAALRVAATNASVEAALTATAIEATAPEISVNTTLVDFGRVDPNTEVAAELVAVELANIDEDGVSAVITGSVFTVTPANLSENGNVSISLNTEDKGVYEETLTLSATGAESKEITVRATVASKWDITYTSNVELTKEGGTSATASKVRFSATGTQYDAIKCGTGNVTGAMKITVPAQTKKLHLHAAAWKGENVTLNITGAATNPTSLGLTADEGVSNNSPYTLQNSPLSQAFDIDIPESETATELTLTASGGKRFVVYGANQEGGVMEVTSNTNVSSLGDVETQPIVASGDITLTIDVPTTTPSITAKNGAKVVIKKETHTQAVVVEQGSKLVAEKETHTPVVHLSVTMGSTHDQTTVSELEEVSNIILPDGGEIHYDITWGTSMAGTQADPNQWHAFTVPFPVDALNGIYNAETGDKLTNEVDYAIMSYHGDLRAEGKYGWKKFRGTLVPGTFYLMTLNGDIPTFRFKKTANGALNEVTSMDVTAYGGTDETNPDYGWNGIGNPSWSKSKVEYPVQVLDPWTYTYVTRMANAFNFSPCTPFFYKANWTGSMAMLEANASNNYAPARTPADEIKNMAVSFGNEVYKDQLYISASEDALNSYEQDKDLVKMTMSNTPKVAQIFGSAYGMKLSMVNTPLVNDKAEVALTLYAPQAGEYTIAAPKMSNAEVYLMREGTVIWNLSTSDYTADFDKGNNAGYSIMIQARAPQIITDLENINALDGENGVQKLLIDGQIYILRNEKMYDVNGKMVK